MPTPQQNSYRARPALPPVDSAWFWRGHAAPGYGRIKNSQGVEIVAPVTGNAMTAIGSEVLYAPSEPVGTIRLKEVVVPTVPATARRIKVNLAILYSLVNEAKREFWIKTPKWDRKIFEIDNQRVFRPQTSFGDQVNDQTILSVGGTFTTRIPQGGSISFRESNTLSNPGGDGSVFGETITNLARVSAGPDETDTDSALTAVPGAGVSGGFCRTFQYRISDGSGSANNPVGTSTITILNITSPTITNTYEAWLSLSKRTAYVIVKELVDTPSCGDPNPLDEYQKLHLISVNSQGTPKVTSYDYDEVITTRPQNWRQASENYLKVEDQSATANACYDDFLDSDDVNFSASAFYQIDLAQIIESETLEDALQGSEDITADLTTREITDQSATCILETAATSSVAVPAIDKAGGTIEGIAYLP